MEVVIPHVAIAVEVIVLVGVLVDVMEDVVMVVREVVSLNALLVAEHHQMAITLIVTIVKDIVGAVVLERAAKIVMEAAEIQTICLM